MKAIVGSLFGVSFLTTVLGLSGTASAIPLVYSCSIVDYVLDGEHTTEFQFRPDLGFKSFSSEWSEVRLNVNEAGTFHLSLRPLADHRSYARTEGYSTPLKIRLTHVAPTLNYASTVRCDL